MSVIATVCALILLGAMPAPASPRSWRPMIGCETTAAPPHLQYRFMTLPWKTYGTQPVHRAPDASPAKLRALWAR